MLTSSTSGAKGNVARVHIERCTILGVTAARATYHHGNLRRELLDAALALFRARGTLEFTMRELAREAGVSHNAPYRHFAGKAELVAALREEGFAELALSCQSAVAREEGHRARVRALGEAYVRFAVDHPDWFRVMLLHTPGAGAPDHARGRAFEMLEGSVEAGRAAGAFRSDLSTREITLTAWAIVHGLASLVVEGHVPAGAARLRAMMRTFDAVFFEGAGAPPARPPKRR